MQLIINTFISPKKFHTFAKRLRPWLIGFFIASLTIGLVDGLFFAPPDAVQGDAYRILYIHAPAAFLSLFIYAVMTGAAFFILVFRLRLAALVMKESAMLGLGFTAIALITGSLWGKPMWGTWWLWDARLTSELILFFIYASYLLLQSALITRPHHERALAILVLVGSVDLPIIHYSVNWWHTLHQGPTLKLFGTSSIAPSMCYPLISMIFAFLCYYTLLLFKRIHYQLEKRA